MSDTLRSIAEKWHKWAEECRARAEDIKLAGLILTREETLDDCAAELEALRAEYEKWLAVNLEHIKAEARLEEAQWWEPRTVTHGLGWEHDTCRERIAALEALAKEKP